MKKDTIKTYVESMASAALVFTAFRIVDLIKEKRKSKRDAVADVTTEEEEEEKED